MSSTFDWRSKPLDPSLDSLKTNSKIIQKISDASISPYYRIFPGTGLTKFKKLKLGPANAKDVPP